MIDYQQATWRIQVAHGSFIEISVNGCGSDKQVVSADEVIRAGRILAEVGTAAKRIVRRWSINEAKTPDAVDPVLTDSVEPSTRDANS